VLPNLGDRLLANVGNAAMKELTEEKMLDAGLSTQLVFQFCAVRNNTGLRSRKRNWWKFSPTLHPRYSILFALLAGQRIVRAKAA
jgi:hypothetical protein